MDVQLVYLEVLQFLVSNFSYKMLKRQICLCYVDPFQ